MSSPAFSYHTEYFGQEKEPVVVMDNFSGKLDILLHHAKSQQFSPGSAYYPGVQAQADVNYLTLRRKELPQIMRDVFGLQHGINIESCMYALVTRAPEKLAMGQRLPHHDGNDSNLFALLHYIQGSDDAGTAFYRHKRTGFETVTEERAEAYSTALKDDVTDFGNPPARYFYGDDERYEMIGEVKARPDRAILYRGRTLHSGCIPAGTTDAPTLDTARMTLNTFIWDTPS